MTSRLALEQSQVPATRMFIWSGFVWQLCTISYWTMFFVRVVVDVHLDPLELVLLGTAKEVTILSAEIPTGIVADMVSRRLSVIIGFVICGLAIVGAGLAGGFALLALTQVLWAFGSTFRSGAETAWYTDEVGSVELVDAVLPRRARYQAAGAIVGVVGSASLAARAGLTVSLVAIGAILTTWAVVLTVRMKETGFTRPEERMRTRFRPLLNQGIEASRRPALRILLIATVMTGFGSEAVDRLNVARLDQVGLPETISTPVVIGAVVVTEMIGSILVLLLFSRRLAGKGLVPTSVVLHIGTGIGVGFVAATGSITVALVALVVVGMLREVAETVTVAWANHFTHSSNRATVHSFVGQAESLGEISGGLVLGVVAKSTGIATALAVSAVIYVLAAIVASLGRRRWHESLITTTRAPSSRPQSMRPRSSDGRAEPMG